LAALPWGLLLLALGGCVMGVGAGLAAAVLCAAGVALVQARRMSVGLRLAVLLALNGVAYAAGFVLIVGLFALYHFGKPGHAGSSKGPGRAAQVAAPPVQPPVQNVPPQGAPPAQNPPPQVENVPPRGAPPAPNVPPRAAEEPLPPAKEIFAHAPRVYLAELQEFDVRNGPWPFAKNGSIGTNPIRVAGVRSPRGLGMHPPWAPEYAAAKYRLGKQAAVFRAIVAINDSSTWCWSPATFTVLGDGKALWQSKAISHDHEHTQQCSVSVSGVDVLELRVQVVNGSEGVHAVWIEPRLLQKADTPDADQPPALFARGPRVYLSDLDEIDVKAGPWPFSKSGVIGPGNNPIAVNGVASPKGLGLHPPDAPDYAAVRYRLGKQAAVFKAAVALNDTAQFVRSQAVFEVYGDAKRLWASAPAGKDTKPQECSVAVSGVDMLELRVTSAGSHFGLHAVWLEPRLLQKAETPDR
jgi:hypothetical protein